MKKIFTLFSILIFLVFPNTAFAVTGSVATYEGINAHADDVLFHSDNMGPYYSFLDESKDSTSDDTLVALDEKSFFYVGSYSPFDTIYFDVTTSSSGSRSCFKTLTCKQVDLEYYNGLTDAWESITYTDNTNNLKKIGINSFEFDFPDAWYDSSNVNIKVGHSTSYESDEMYFVRLKTKSDVSFSSYLYVAEVAVRSYNLNLLVTDELGNVISDLEESDFELSGGTSNDIAGFLNAGDGIYKFALDLEQSDGNYNLQVQKDDFVHETVATGTMSSTTTDSWAILEYTHRINIEDESGVGLLPDSASIDGVACKIDDSSVFCNVHPADDDSAGNPKSVDVVIDGESHSIALADERDDYEDVQVVTTGVIESATESTSSSSTTTGSIEINVETEAGDAIKSLSQSSFEVSGGSDNSIYGFTNNADGSYELTLETGSNYTIKAIYDGYESSSFTAETGDTESVLMKFAYKVKVEDEDGDTISGGNVRAGDDYGLTCKYISSGYYGCAVPLSDSNYSFRAGSYGYYVYNGNFDSDRTSNDDDQQIETAVLSKKSSSTSTDGEDVSEDCSSSFDDIYGHWAEGYIEELYCRGVISGKSEESFAPNDNITRAEFLKIALLNAGYDVSGSTDSDFSDVSSGDWFYEYVSFATENEFTEGYDDGTFKPNDSINRAEAIVILMRIADEKITEEYSGDEDFSDVSSDDWFAEAVGLAYETGITEGYSDGTFRPANNISRAEVAAIAVRAYSEFYE